MFKVVVVGADDSSTARRAIEAAAEISQISGGVLHIVTAFGSKLYDEGSRPEEFAHINSEGEVDALLQELSFIAKRRGIEPVLHGVKGPAADVIIEMADELGADLVVVGNRGMKGVHRVLGSVPNSVAHGANCSVAIIDTSE